MKYVFTTVFFAGLLAAAVTSTGYELDAGSLTAILFAACLPALTIWDYRERPKSMNVRRHETAPALPEPRPHPAKTALPAIVTKPARLPRAAASMAFYRRQPQQPPAEVVSLR